MTQSAMPVDLTQFAENMISHLPAGATVRYEKAECIYTASRPSRKLYLLTAGKVGLSQITAGGREILLDIVKPGEFFGESGFFRLSLTTEHAAALEEVRLLSWPINAIVRLMEAHHGLALAFLQVFAERSVHMAGHIESLAVETAEQRLARALIRFGNRFGTPQADGSIQMAALSHELLASYVGTSREVVTHRMNDFRRDGGITYCRSGITITPAFLAAWTSLEKFTSRRAPIKAAAGGGGI